MSVRQNDDEELNENQKRNILFKNNQIKIKKRIIPIDREQLYAQNLQLKAKIRDLVETNTKIKTQLSINQKQKTNLFNIAEQQAFHPKIPQRSQSGNHKKSMPNQPNLTHLSSLLTSQLTKQKQNIAFKKILRDYKMQNERLYNQNQKLKKTMKFTRMNEILTQNKELLDESLRLKIKLTEFKQAQNLNLSQFMNEIQNLRKKLAIEKDSQKKNGFQLKKQYDINNEIRQKLRQAQSKKIQMQKRFNKEIKLLKAQNIQIKNKLIQNSDLKSRQNERNQFKKQKADMKKKIQNLQRQLKRMKEDNQLNNKKYSQRQTELRKNYQTQIKKAQSKSSYKKDTAKIQQETQRFKSQARNSQIQNKNNSKFETNNKSQENTPQKEEKKVEKNEKVVIKQQPIKNIIQNHINLKQADKKTQEKLQKPQKKHQQHPQLASKQLQVHKQTPTKGQQHEDKHKSKNSIHNIIENKKQVQHDQSYDTDKLLASFQGGNYQNQQRKDRSVQKLVQKHKKQQSDGQYQEINFQDQDQQQYKEEKLPKKQEKLNKKGKKSSSLQQSPQGIKKVQKSQKIQKAQNAQKGQKDQKKKHKKDKSEKDLHKDKKSKKKLHQQKGQQQYDKKQQNEGGKSEVKLIRDTLLYKFIAQKYTYNDFCTDIQSSGIKEFTIQQVMGILGQQPFLLGEQNIQHILIYLFQTDQLTEDEKITTKSFMKKMKKFVGKAQEINEEQYNKKLQKVKTIVEKDENGGKKIRKKCKQFDEGEGTISKQAFTTVMSMFNIKAQLLQTALSQIVYISSDLEHLNYDFFLKRLTEDQEYEKL